MSPARPRRSAAAGRHRRLITATVAGVLLAVTASACSQARVAPPAPAVPRAAGPAAEPQPAADGPCSYLPAASVQDVNGERVTGVRVSGTGPDRPYPACFFLTYRNAVQLRTWIVVATPAAARATLDAVAPVATSDLAELPGGWSGGSQPTEGGAVFAVVRQGTAVVITTNQRQTIGARRIAQQVIATLGL